MVQIKQPQIRRDEIIDLPTFCEKLSKAKDVETGCVLIKDHLQLVELDLLSVKYCDTLGQKPSIRPFSAYPKAISEVSQALMADGGCPIAKEVLIRLKPFEVGEIDKTRYVEFLDVRFLQELQKMDHKYIAAIPIVIGRGIALYTIGLGDKPFAGDVRDELINFICHANTALLCAFPGIAQLFDPKILSLQEAQMVFHYGNGDRFSEIAAAFGYSEHTIQMMLQGAVEKLGAKNLPHLLTKALASGEIQNMQSS
jgi:DNA-binding CsgD family transcriptional regulator